MKSKIYLVQIVAFMVSILLSTQSSPVQFRSVDRSKSSHDILRNHFESNIQRNPESVYMNTVSDAMQLYSIKARRIVVIQQKPNTKPWDHIYQLSIKERRRKNGKSDKFITETVSYGRLKIRSEDDDLYICVRNNGEIVLKRSAENRKKQRPRKRCLFNWTFTEQMHMKLSVEAGKKTWYLTVRNDAIGMTEKDRSTELERSFIWLPAKSKGANIPQMSRMRSFDGSKVLTVCDSQNNKIFRQNAKISFLKNRVEEFEQEIERLKLEKQMEKLKLKLEIEALSKNEASQHS